MGVSCSRVEYHSLVSLLILLLLSYCIMVIIGITEFLCPWLPHLINIGFLYVRFTFSTRMIYSGAPGFVTDCLCGVWCRGLITCLLYVSPLFGNKF